MREALAKPIDGYKWKIQSFNKVKTWGMCVPYIDARDVENRLDEVCGVNGWQDEFYQVKDTMFCKIGILIDGVWVWKSGAGVEKSGDDDVKFKGEASDAFKLAGVKWGIGRFLYDIDSVWVKVVEKKPVDEKGREIKDLTDHIKSRLANPKEPEHETREAEGEIDVRTDVKLVKESAIKEINKAHALKRISDQTKEMLTNQVEEALSIKECDLVISRLDLIDYFIKLKPYMDAGVQEHYINQINKITIQSAKLLRTEFDRLSMDYGLGTPKKYPEKGTDKFKPEKNLDSARNRIEKGFDALDYSTEKRLNTETEILGCKLWECKDLEKLNKLLEELVKRAVK